MKTKVEEIATQIGGKIIEYDEWPVKILRIEDEEIECYDRYLSLIDLNIEDRNKIKNNDELIICVARIERDGLIFKVSNIILLGYDNGL